MIKFELTNNDIKRHFKDIELHLMLDDFVSAFSYWIVFQNPNSYLGVEKAIKAYENYLLKNLFKTKNSVEKLNFETIKSFVSSKIFESIPEIFEFNQSEPDFIDLGALERNIFYMILRLEITQPLGTN